MLIKHCFQFIKITNGHSVHMFLPKAADNGSWPDSGQDDENWPSSVFFNNFWLLYKWLTFLEITVGGSLKGCQQQSFGNRYCRSMIFTGQIPFMLLNST